MFTKQREVLRKVRIDYQPQTYADERCQRAPQIYSALGQINRKRIRKRKSEHQGKQAVGPNERERQHTNPHVPALEDQKRSDTKEGKRQRRRPRHRESIKKRF